MFEKIRIGTAQLQGGYGVSSSLQLKKKEFKKILDFAKRYKINKIDTSELYGSSHRILKDLCIKHYHIGTKIKILKKKKKIFLIKKIHKIISQFQRDLDYILIHNFKDSSISDIVKTLKIIIEIKEQKKIDFEVGVSIYDRDDFIKLKKILNLININYVQIPINIFNQEFLEKKYFSILKKNNIKVQARSIFLQGLLLMSSKDIKEKFYFNDLKKFKKWDEFNDYKVKKKYLNLVQFIKLSKNIDEIVVGFKNLGEFKDFCIAYKKKKSVNLQKFKSFSCKDQKINLPMNWRQK